MVEIKTLDRFLRSKILGNLRLNKQNKSMYLCQV